MLTNRHFRPARSASPTSLIQAGMDAHLYRSVRDLRGFFAALRMTNDGTKPYFADPSVQFGKNLLMKKRSLLVVALEVTTFCRAAAPQFSPVSFALGLQKFADGDSIVIREVLASSPSMDVGDTVVVRGEYILQSQDRANLGLSLTQTESHEPTKVVPAGNTLVKNGHGGFELTCEVRQVGCLHITFSSLPERKSFGTVYFGTAEQLFRVRDMHWEHE
jgi:hypothetical protein